jgi:hypothetical protein
MSQKRTLSDEVRDWFERTGLPLELDTVASFRKAGFSVEHSSIYADPQHDKGREIDVIAYSRDPTGLVQIYVVAECKASKQPWVVLVDKQTPSGVTFASMGVSTEFTKKSVTPDFLHTRSDVGFLLRNLHTNGYALRQAFSKDHDPAYAAAMSAMNAAIAIAGNESSSMPRLRFVLPVIVVDAPIVECSLGIDGSLSFEEIAFSEFLFTAYLPDRTSAVIRVISAEALPSQAIRLANLANAVKEALKPVVDQKIDEWRARQKQRRSD